MIVEIVHYCSPSILNYRETNDQTSSKKGKLPVFTDSFLFQKLSRQKLKVDEISVV